MHRFLSSCILSNVFLTIATTVARSADPSPGGRFRVTVTPVFSEEDAIVVQIAIESKSDGYVNLRGVRPRSGGVSTALTSKKEGGMRTAQIAVLLDQVTVSDQQEFLKFTVSAKNSRGGGSRLTSTGTRKSDGALSSLFELPLKAGEYKLETPVEAFRFRGNSYKLSVTMEPLLEDAP